MENTVFDLQSYLTRIGYSGDLGVNLATLSALQLAHLQHVPFENFDICLGKGIDLKTSTLFEKIVNQQRGGYCFELNGLFIHALKQIGFAVRPVLARVHLGEEPTGRGHLLGLVSLAGKQYLVDVGFGGSTPKQPVLIQFDTPAEFAGQCLRLREDKNFGYMLQLKQGQEWQNLYSTDLGYVCAGDIAYGNHYTSTNDNSLFVTARVASRLSEDGAITLHNFSLKKVSNGKEIITQIAAGEEYLKMLSSTFGIELACDYQALRAI